MEEIRLKLQQIDEELESLEHEDWSETFKEILKGILEREKAAILKDYNA
jgi:aminoglycoside/choline kinase family phosphotransferase